VTEEPSLLEKIRQTVIVGVILGIRRGIGQVKTAATGDPSGGQSLAADEIAAQTHLIQGNYDRAFEVATGFAEYFEIARKAKAIGSSAGETAGGHGGTCHRLQPGRGNGQG
jgi:hypothetical protein